MNAWTMLGIAILFEIVGTSLLKLSDGFTHWIAGTASIACYTVSFIFMAAAIKVIPVGIAYAVWSGLGIVAITIIGWLAFKQDLTAIQIGFITLIAVGAIGLNLTAQTQT